MKGRDRCWTRPACEWGDLGYPVGAASLARAREELCRRG